MVSETTNSHVYPKANEGGETASVAPNPSFPNMEETVLKYWDKDDTFNKSVERNPSGDHSQNEFVFFDGPPFANGLPHYDHRRRSSASTRSTRSRRWASTSSMTPAAPPC